MPTISLGAAFNVGLIGHRNDRLARGDPEAVRRDLGATLAAIKAEAGAAVARLAAEGVFPDGALNLSLVVSLAEGADRMGAHAALAEGYGLQAPLPLPRADYEADFPTEDSRREFRALADQAVVLELPGLTTGAEKRDRAYHLSAQVLLDHCDLLIAVWDGNPPAGRGGTAMTIDEACAADLPVVIIDSNGRRPPRLIWKDLDPAAVSAGDPAMLPSAGLAEGLKRVIPDLMRPPGRKAVAELRRFLSEALPTRAENAFNAAFHRADALSIRCAARFRRAVVCNFSAAFLTVALAAAGLALIAARGQGLVGPWADGVKTAFTAIEIGLLLLIFGVTFAGRRAHWHRRWIEYRELAEKIRIDQALRMVGARVFDFKGAAGDWRSWYGRACLRQAGLPPVVFDQASLGAAKAALEDLARDQSRYHERAARRAHALEQALELGGLAAFALALLVLAATLTGIFPDGGWRIAASLMTILLPALGSALLGVRFILDPGGVRRRSLRAAEAYRRSLDNLASEAPELGRLRMRAFALADVVLGDVSTWRLSAESRSLKYTL